MTVHIKTQAHRLLECDSAQDVAEYAVLLAVVLLIVVITASSLGTSARTIVSKAGTAIATPSGN